MRTRSRLTLWSAIFGTVLIGSSVLLLTHDRSLPQAFGQIPGEGSPSAATATAAAGPPLQVSSGSTMPKAHTPTFVEVPPSAAGPAPQSRGPAAGAPSPHASVSAMPRRQHSGRSSVVLPATNPGLPSRIQIATLHVSASITEVTTSGSGVLDVPQDPARVGWWVGSALPGSATGTTVLDGHIDSATAGVGAFWQLSELVAGDRITVEVQPGSAVNYRVVARRVYPKNAGLPTSLFSSTGPPVLLLISCGGPFDSARGSYEDNIAVFATPDR